MLKEENCNAPGVGRGGVVVGDMKILTGHTGNFDLSIFSNIPYIEMLEMHALWWGFLTVTQLGVVGMLTAIFFFVTNPSPVYSPQMHIDSYINYHK